MPTYEYEFADYEKRRVEWLLQLQVEKAEQEKRHLR